MKFKYCLISILKEIKKNVITNKDSILSFRLYYFIGIYNCEYQILTGELTFIKNFTKDIYPLNLLTNTYQNLPFQLK